MSNTTPQFIKLPSPRKFSTIPSTISPEEIEYSSSGLIDSGSFGSVYFGKVRELPAAIKVLKNSKMTQADLEIFTREVEIVKNNSHPNIVRYLGVCAEPDNFIIVTEFVPGGNLGQLLSNKKKVLSLFQLMKIGKEVALGMNWLHNAKPQIIHRDLKLTNVLLDTNLTSKICDFGLSQEKYSKFLCDPSTGARGTPLWMAPEVLMLKPFDEKCDVYSFGLLLWCLISRSEPFEEFQDFEPFFKAVCIDHYRPTIPQNTLPSLITLIEQCWHKESEKRPSCAQIVQSLYLIMIELAVKDENGIQFWKENYFDQQSVSWDNFINMFLNKYVLLSQFPTKKEIENASDIQLLEYQSRNTHNISIVSKEWIRRKYKQPDISFENELEIIVLCLKMVFVETKSNEKEIVELEHFGEILNWFGPIIDKSGNISIVTRIVNMLENKAFHGNISAKMAQEKLRLCNKPGTYLIRFSSLPGQYALSHINQDNISQHTRISYKIDQGFYYNKKYYPTLNELIKVISPELKLTEPCPNSKYQSIFNESYKKRYNGVYYT